MEITNFIFEKRKNTQIHQSLEAIDESKKKKEETKVKNKKKIFEIDIHMCVFHAPRYISI